MASKLGVPCICSASFKKGAPKHDSEQCCQVASCHAKSGGMSCNAPGATTGLLSRSEPLLVEPGPGQSGVTHSSRVFGPTAAAAAAPCSRHATQSTQSESQHSHLCSDASMQTGCQVGTAEPAEVTSARLNNSCSILGPKQSNRLQVPPAVQSQQAA